MTLILRAIVHPPPGRIQDAYEKVPQHNLESKDVVLQQITEIIREYDEGQSAEWDMPF
jgi:hypothetical protein